MHKVCRCPMLGLRVVVAEDHPRTRTQAIPPLVEKGLSSTRAATKSNSVEALLLYIELDTPGPVVEELVPVLSHKQPKIIAATLNALTTICHAYGCKTVDPKPVLKALPKVFGHADKNVRAEAQSLAVELYRWLKEAMKPVFWGDLKPVQQQDLEALFEKVKQDPPPSQERFLRSQQEAMAMTSGGGGDDEAIARNGDEGDTGDAPEMDAFDLAEPVDIGPKIPGDLFDNLASTKWKDRKDGLDALHAAANVPRIKDSDFAELNRSLAKCMKDANIAVVTVAANCVEALAKGLRGDFAKYRSMVMSPMMERLKEKKQSVTDALGAALDAAFASTSLSDCLDDTLEFLKHKNPQVKLESVRFLIRCLRTTRDAPTKSEVKLISDAATKLLTESSEVVRSAAAEVLGTVMKIMGERAMNPYLDGLDEIRKTKIKEYYEKAEVKAKDKPKPAAATAPAPAKVPKHPTGGKKPTDKKPASGAPKAGSSAATAAASIDDEPAPKPLLPKPTGRSIPSKSGGPSKMSSASAGGSTRMQKPVAGTGATASANPSPMKPPTSRSIPSPVGQEEVSVPPKLALGGRGLAGRPLGKPASVAGTSTESVLAATSSGMSEAERVELEELRGENERLRRANEELKMERSRLTSQVHELQNQNAELIEDHTRDVLSIKAKETQLVRARSDAEAAEQTCQKQQREMERLKRELSRAVRAATATGSGLHSGSTEEIYRDVNGATTAATSSSNSINNYGMNNQHPGGGGGRAPITTRRPPFVSSMSSSEEKENHGGYEAVDLLRSAKLSPSLSSVVSSSGTTGGRGSPSFSAGGGGREIGPQSGSGGAGPGPGASAGTGSGGASGVPAGGTAANGEGIESWKRAAEVTSALKARIEQMKVC